MQGEVDAGTAAGVVGGVDVAAVAFNDAVTDGEPESGAAARVAGGVGAIRRIRPLLTNGGFATPRS